MYFLKFFFRHIPFALFIFSSHLVAQFLYLSGKASSWAKNKGSNILMNAQFVETLCDGFHELSLLGHKPYFPAFSTFSPPSPLYVVSNYFSQRLTLIPQTIIFKIKIIE
jgi:hypothetical protein